MLIPAVVCVSFSHPPNLNSLRTDKMRSRLLRRKPCRLPPDEAACIPFQITDILSVYICPAVLLRSGRPGCSVLPSSEYRTSLSHQTAGVLPAASYRTAESYPVPAIQSRRLPSILPSASAPERFPAASPRVYMRWQKMTLLWETLQGSITKMIL